MIGAILGGATALMSGISAIANFAQAKKDAQSAADTANRMMGMQETNKMAAIQTQDISSLSRQETAQQTAGMTQALAANPETAIGGIVALAQANREAEAQTAEKQAALNLDVEMAKAQAAQGVEYRNLGLRREIEGARLTGAQQSAADRRAAGLNDLTGVFTGSGMAIQDILAMSNPYGENQI